MNVEQLAIDHLRDMPCACGAQEKATRVHLTAAPLERLSFSCRMFVCPTECDLCGHCASFALYIKEE